MHLHVCTRVRALHVHVCTYIRMYYAYNVLRIRLRVCVRPVMSSTHTT